MGAMIPLSILAIFLSFQLSAAVGDWEPIQDLSNPAVVRIAKFVVTTYNNNERVYGKFEYKFVRVFKGHTQVVVNGTNYRLLIHARAFIGGVEHEELVARLVAVVYEGSGGKGLKVVSIKRIIQE